MVTEGLPIARVPKFLSKRAFNSNIPEVKFLQTACVVCVPFLNSSHQCRNIEVFYELYVNEVR